MDATLRVVAGWQLVAGNFGTILPRLVASGVGYAVKAYPPVATLASARDIFSGEVATPIEEAAA